MPVIRVGAGATLVINGETHECVGQMEFEVADDSAFARFAGRELPGSEVVLSLEMEDEIADEMIADLHSGRTVAITEEIA